MQVCSVCMVSLMVKLLGDTPWLSCRIQCGAVVYCVYCAVFCIVGANLAPSTLRTRVKLNIDHCMQNANAISKASHVKKKGVECILQSYELHMAKS